MRKVPISAPFLPSASLTTITGSFEKIKIVAFAGMGNALELYDFTLYGIMLPFFAKQFFPSSNPMMSLLMGYVSFALTFLIAPIGSIFWGWVGERQGRAAMLRWTMMVMALPSLIVAFLPDFSHIGWWAPIILMIVRIVQGISAGGEVMGSKLFSMELLGESYHGRCSGWISALGAGGIFLGLMMSYCVSRAPTDIEAWRFPFLFGASLFVFAFFMRSLIKLKANERVNFTSKLFDVLPLIKSNASSVGVVFILGAYLGIASYALHAFTNPYLVQYGISSEEVYSSSLLGMMGTIMTAIVSGYYLDKSSRSFILTRYSLWAAVLMYVPFFVLLLLGKGYTLVGFIGLDCILGTFATAATVVMFRIFTPEARCRGLLFSYAMGCSIFGGLTPILMQALSILHPVAPAILPLSTAALTLFFLKNVRSC